MLAEEVRLTKESLPKVWDWRMHSTQILFTQTYRAQTQPYLTHDAPDQKQALNIA